MESTADYPGFLKKIINCLLKMPVSISPSFMLININVHERAQIDSKYKKLHKEIYFNSQDYYDKD